MRDHPDTERLLSSARDALMEQVVPALEGEARATALMVARSLAVVAARLATDARERAVIESAGEVSELATLAGLLAKDPSAVRQAEGATLPAIAHLSAQLAAAIRSGRFDPASAQHPALVRFLLEVTRAKVAESNAKSLEHAGREEGQGA